jgi:type VI secretion system protein ImpH
LAYVERGAAANLNINNIKLSQTLFPKASNYSFFQLVDLLHRLHSDDQEKEQDFKADNQRIVFSSSAKISFARSDVQQLDFVRNENDTAWSASFSNDNQYALETTFLGLHGSQSPLPYHYLDITAREESQKYHGLSNFLDFFNQRLLVLFYRSWRKYRYYLRFQPDATDAFSQQMFSLVGLADRSLRQKTQINWCKMLSYAGTLAARSRSPQVVAGIVAHYFELKNVEIEQWVFRRIDIPDFQTVKVGQQNCALGENFVIGNKAPDRRGKFVLHIKGLTHSRFRDFLPNGKDYSTLVKLIEFTFREPLAYDLSLGMIPEELTPMQVGNDKSARLGWTTFVGDSLKLQKQQRNVLIHVRS